MKSLHKMSAALFAGSAAILLSVVFFLSQKPQESFSDFCETLFREEMTGNTLNLHFTLKDPAAAGITSYEISLGAQDAQTPAAALAELDALAGQLNAFSDDDLTEEEQLTHALLTDYVARQRALASFPYYDEPLTPSNGTTAQLPVLLAEYAFSDEQDVTDYLALLAQMDTYFSGILEYEQAKAAEGLFMSDRACEKVIESCEVFTEHPDDNFLLETFAGRLDTADGLSEAQKADYCAQNAAVVAEHVIPAYEAMETGLTQLLGCGRNDWGLCYYEDGRAYYEALAAADTGCDDGAESLFSQIAAARDEDLETCRTLLAQDPSLMDASASLPAALSDADAMLAALQTAMLADFPAPPDVSCEIVHAEPALRDFLAPAFYITAPIDDRHHTIYINNADDYVDLYFFTTLAHEGYPGHLYQTAFTADCGAPFVRALLNYPGYTEGWATYVEMQAFFYAGLDDALAALLSHNQAMILSLYASTDIGVHYYGWKTEEIADFWADYGVDDADTLDEIARLVLDAPANYLRYYVGYLKFRQLREKTEETLGAAFDAKAFHEAILRIGPSSFPVLESFLET